MTLWKRTYQYLRSRLSDQDGAVTVDFVVITAFAIGIAIAITISVGGTAVDHSERIDDKFDETGIGTY